jgi:hypothetical protein
MQIPHDDEWSYLEGRHLMEALSDFISSVVEFLVGGILFTLALGYLLLGITGVPHIDADAKRVLGQSSAVLPIAIIFIFLVYALGVVAESAARAIFEVVLDRLTVRKPEFLETRTTSAVSASASSSASSDSSERSSSRPTKFRTRLTKLLHGDGKFRTRLTEFLLGDDYTVEDRNAARSERESQRARIMTFHPSLHAEVQGQLKRLRLERVFALSMGIFTVALAIRGSIGWSIVGLVTTGGLCWLVKTRFGRYCGAIARANKLIVRENMRQVDPAEQSG